MASFVIRIHRDADPGVGSHHEITRATGRIGQHPDRGYRNTRLEDRGIGDLSQTDATVGHVVWQVGVFTHNSHHEDAVGIGAIHRKVGDGPGVVIEAHKKNFESGMKVIAHLTAGSVYLCHDPHTYLPTGLPSKVKVHEFSGVHPAGLVGTHIHFLEPVSEKKTVWHISYQDVIAVGKLFTTGKVWGKRMVSLAGPLVKDPCLYEVPLGANTEDLCKGLVEDDDMRVVSGSLFSGHHAQGPFSFLGRYHLQVCVLREGRERELLGWQMPGFDKFSVKNAFFSKLLPGGRKFAFTTSTGGSVRAMVPVGPYEKVMPLDVEPTFLLRSLLSRDLEQAALLGVLELDEEDLGLCTFVCPGKV